MKTKIGYIVISFLCASICVGIVIVNINDHLRAMQLTEEPAFNFERSVYSNYTDINSNSDLSKTININTATAQELVDFLPNIGIRKAENIVAYRNATGGFKSVEELIEVDGIGESTLAIIRSYCRISD